MADENDEKFDEKEMEKREEKSPEEKSWEEKWQRDPLTTLVWAAIFIWAGLILLASNLGMLDAILNPPPELAQLGWFGTALSAWSLVLAGAGVIILIEVAVRLLVPAYRKPVLGRVIIALILIGLGLGDLVNWGIIWAVVLIILGISIVLRGSRRSNR